MIYYEKHRPPRRGRRGCRGAANTPPCKGRSGEAASTARASVSVANTKKE